MQGRDWQIGRILGIPIKVHVSWFFVFLFVTWSLATGYLPDVLPGLSSLRYWGIGGVAAVLLFVSVLLHELGHSYVALRYKIPISQITLFVFGGMAQMRKEPPGPRAEFLIAIAGPIVSFLLAGILLGGWLYLNLPNEFNGVLALGFLLGSINLQLGLFNLIPGFPLDGGRVLRAVLWSLSGDFYQATNRAALAGQGFGLLFALFGVWLILGGNFGFVDPSLMTHGSWIILIGGFLFVAARSSRRQSTIRASLAGIAVRDVMVHQVVTLEPDLTIEDCVTGHFFQYGYAAFPVVQDEKLLGLVTVEHLQSLPRNLWAWRKVRDLMLPWTREMEIASDASVLQALEFMIASGRSRLVVVDQGKVMGLVTQSGIVRLLPLGAIQRSERQSSP